MLLNLSRDQLDRVNEVRMLAQRWRDAMIARCVTGDGGRQRRRSARRLGAQAQDEPKPHGRARTFCSSPQGSCGTRTRRGARRAAGGSPSTSSGMVVHVRILPSGARRALDAGRPRAERRSYPSDLSVLAGALQPCERCDGRGGRSVLGTDEAVALEAMRSVSEVEGRFSTVRVDGVSARLLLAKNPAGWAELLGSARTTPRSRL